MSVAFWCGAYSAELQDGTAAGIGALAQKPDGTLDFLGLAAEAQSPSYLARGGAIIYAALEGSDAVAAFKVDGTELTPISLKRTGGEMPCNVQVVGRTLVTANYGDGVVSVHPLSFDGALAEPSQTLTTTGFGRLDNQRGPHAHAVLDIGDGVVLTTDLGTDRVWVHSFADGTLERERSIKLPPGSGPRDLGLHPSGYIYVLTEMTGQIFVLDPRTLKVVSSTTVVAGSDGDESAAGISFSPDGLFAYVGLRRRNAIAVVAISPDGGRLKPVDSISSGGLWPRHHIVDGELIHVANQHSSTIATFRIADNGIPQQVGGPCQAPSPAFLLRA